MTYSFRNIYEELSSQDTNFLDQFDLKVKDKLEKDGYGVYLIEMPEEAVQFLGGIRYQLAINKHKPDTHTSFTDMGQHSQKHVKPGETFPIHILKDIIEQIILWIRRYKQIWVSSESDKKVELYKKIFSKVGIKFRTQYLMGQYGVLLHDGTLTESILLENTPWLIRKVIVPDTKEVRHFKVIETNHAIQRELERGATQELRYKKLTGFSRRAGLTRLANKAIDYFLRNELRLPELSDDGRRIVYLVYSESLHQGWVVDFRLDNQDASDKFKNLYVITVLPINAHEPRDTKPNESTVLVMLP